MVNRVLLVDDDPVFRKEFVECFQEYGIAEAASGEEALNMLRRPHEIDLAILDVRMSGLNGIEVLAKMRKQTPGIRIVIMTGYGSKDVAVEALRAQADDYIEKPPEIDATRAIIEKFLGTKRGEPESDSIDIKAKIERVKRFLERNALKKVSLKDAAATVYLSPKYLSRIFREVTGEGFSDYKLKGKIEAAKELLLKTGLNVNQVSDKLGYENTESFIRQFKSRTGRSPTEFRIRAAKQKKKKRRA